MLVEIGGKLREKVDLGVLGVVLGGSRVVLGGGQLGSFRGQTHPLLRLAATLSAGRNRVKLHEKVDLGVVLGGNRVILGGKVIPH